MISLLVAIASSAVVNLCSFGRRREYEPSDGGTFKYTMLLLVCCGVTIVLGVMVCRIK
jgi:hypothetical protein